MKHLLSLSILVAIGFTSFVSMSFVIPTAEEEGNVVWYTWEEAIKLNEKNPKKIFIDVYTDWCGWCKRMDKSTFEHPSVSKYLNANFYPIKLNAEMKKDVVYKGHTFKFVQSGRRGHHTLASSLLENRMSYPSCVLMDEDVNRITIVPGYRDHNDMISILKFINEEKYKEMTYDEYTKANKK